MSSSINPKLRLLNGLLSEKTLFGTFIALKGMRLAQTVAHTGLDVLIIDGEHGNIGDSDMHDMVSATTAAGASPVVRIRGPSADLVKRALDTGAHGLVVPMVNTEADARQIVSYSKFPPVGTRGQGAAFPCYEFGLSTPAEYVQQANEKIVIMLQIESVEGLKNVDEISQVDGVDMIFIGPNDLALALLGYAPARGDEPEFIEAIDAIVAAAKKAGKKTGILASSGENAKKMKGKFDLIAIGTEIRAMQTWFKVQLEVVRK